MTTVTGAPAELGGSLAADGRADRRIRVERLGREASPVVVVEDLLADPAPLIEAAHASPFGPPAMAAYPGVRARAPGAYARGLRDALLPVLLDAFGLRGWTLAGATCDFSLVTRRPEALAMRQRIPHTDAADPGLVALLHYLTPGGTSGTSFYRHRSTGFERITPARRDAYEAALARELAEAPPEGYVGGDTPVFERIGGFEGRFNRLVAYSGALLHSGDVPSGFAFSDDPRQGRLTLNTFFSLRPPPAPAVGGASGSGR